MERLLLRRHHDRQRPAARARHHLADTHVDIVDIRPLLAIDLDADKRFVHQCRNLLVLERLALHHVAPMAGGIADRKKDRLVFGLGFFKRLRTPRIPIHRIMRMLQKVWAFLLAQTVCE